MLESPTATSVKNGRKLKAGKYGPSLFKRQKAKRFTNSKKTAGASALFVCHTSARAGSTSSKHRASLHVVFSRKNGEPGVLALATDDPELTPKANHFEAYDGTMAH